MEHTNYIRGENPFGLLGPPGFWLDKLKDFDDSLVVMPSKQAHVYRLCQRRPHDPRAALVSSLMQDSDARQMAAYGLVPVTTILADAKWDNPVMWEDLRQRSPHRMGGAQKFEEMILAQERAKQMKDNEVLQQNLTDRAKDAYGYYLMKAGRRQHMWVPKTHSASTTLKENRSATFRILDAYGKPISSR